MNSFTYTVTSISNVINGVKVFDKANDVNVRFTLPSKYRYFKCKIKNFTINSSTVSDDTDFFYLVSNNFASDGVYNSSNTGTQYIAFVDSTVGLNNNVDIQFYVENPNNKIASFELRDDNGDTVPDNRLNNVRDTIWFLTMEFIPLDEEISNPEYKDGRLKIGSLNNF